MTKIYKLKSDLWLESQEMISTCSVLPLLKFLENILSNTGKFLAAEVDGFHPLNNKCVWGSRVEDS